jgi:hypothetical protein
MNHIETEKASAHEERGANTFLVSWAVGLSALLIERSR